MANENKAKKNNTAGKKASPAKKNTNAKATTKKVSAGKSTSSKKTSGVKKVDTPKKVEENKKVEKVQEVAKPQKAEYVKPPKMKRIATEESKVVKRFIIVLLVVIASVTAIYFITRILVTKDLLNKNTAESSDVTFNYDITILGSAFNRPYDEYYVIIYKGTDEAASELSAAITSYLDKDDHLKIYYADLDSYMNSSFYDKDNVNKEATKASELKVGDYTLIRFNKGTITEYIEGKDNIVSALK